MIRLGMPLTRQTYVDLVWPEPDAPNADLGPLDAEFEAGMPGPFRWETDEDDETP